MRINNKKKVTGTDRSRRKRTPEIEKSKHLDVFDDYQTIFDFLIDLSEKNQLSDGSDSIVIHALAKEMVIYHKSMQDVEARGVIIDFKNGKQEMEQINPSYKAAKMALDNIKALSKECGFTMKSRVLMSAHLIEGEQDDDDPLAGKVPGAA